jgi:DNA-binding transcriptional MerR regulator
MKRQKLTIGQLAAHVGVSQRTVRFYHARGLLPEPPRDESGYRRYDAKAVVDLIRIKTLADAGVPLARIGKLLDATPAEFADAVASIGRVLEERIEQFELHRSRLSELTHGDRLYVSKEIAAILDDERALGLSERTLQIERDAWILFSAVSPEAVRIWAEEKATALTDPEFRSLCLACDHAFDWDPDDPRLEELAARVHEWSTNRRQPGETEKQLSDHDSLAMQLMSADVEDASPAWKRLGGLVPKGAYT